MTKTRLWIKIVNDNGQIGPGKIALLKAVDREGSISAAARGLSMSYRRAWSLLEEARCAIGVPLLETQIGGAKKGGARLTQAAHELIDVYDRIHARTNKNAEKMLASYFARWQRTEGKALRDDAKACD